jgi:hypothetical protein
MRVHIPVRVRVAMGMGVRRHVHRLADKAGEFQSTV